MEKIHAIIKIVLLFMIFGSCGTINTNKEMVNSSADKESSDVHNLKTNRFDFNRKTVKLNNGLEMPIIGIGTYSLTPDQAEESVYNALKNGYRLIDTANAYRNERAVGRGIKKSGVPREEIFVTSKLWVQDYAYEDAKKAIDETLKRLNLEYIDLMLLHQPYGKYTEAYKALEEAVAQGKIKSIGLSNFYTEKFNEIMKTAKIAPAVLQNPANPYNQQKEMRKYIEKYGTVLEAWYPLGGRGNTQQLFNEPVIVKIAKKYNRTSPQVLLRWLLQEDIIAIPGSSNAAHIKENIEIFDF